MHGEILYELHFPMEFIIIQLIFLGMFFLLPKGYSFVIKGSSLEKDKATEKNIKIVSYIAVVFLLMIFMQFDKGLIDMYKQFDKMYEHGKYASIIGKVEDFIPSKVTNKGKESFSINGIIFEYDMLEYKIGYQKIKPLGGKIRNGQRLKLKYIIYNGENRIVYIEKIVHIRE